VAIVPMLAMCVLIATWRPEPGAKRLGDAPGRSRAPHESRRATTFAYLGWLSNIAVSVAFSLIVYLFPYVAHESGISPPVHGVMLAFNRVVVVATYVLMHRFTFWHYRFWTAVATQMCAVLGLLLVGFGNSVAVMALGFGLAGLMLGYNYFAGLYYSMLGFGARTKGVASGVHEGTLALGGVVGVLGGGLIGSLHGSRVPYRAGVAVLLLFLAVELAIFLRARKGWMAQPDAAKARD
jgi:predicted MFS family arabinose efflux permease